MSADRPRIDPALQDELTGYSHPSHRFSRSDGSSELLTKHEYDRRCRTRSAIVNLDPPSVLMDVQCFGCHGRHAYLWSRVSTTGVAKVRSICGNCYCEFPRALKYAWIKHAGIDVEDIPVISDNSCSACGGSGCEQCVRSECAHCGSRTYLHQHHPYRQSTMRRTGKWSWLRVTVVLCRTCHQDLHRDEAAA